MRTQTKSEVAVASALKYVIIKKKAGDTMTEKELITFTIDTYMNLQRIKKANGNQQNAELDYQLKGVIAKLSSMGINVEDLTL